MAQGNRFAALNLIKGGGDHLASRDPAHIRRWVSALNAGAAKARCCTGVTRLGEPCRHMTSRGRDRCIFHPRSSAEMLEMEMARERRHLRKAIKPPTNGVVQAARAGLGRIARSRLHRRWVSDPRIEGSTIEFAVEADHISTIEWLRDVAGLDIHKPLPETGRMLTPRALDRVLWAGWRAVRTDDVSGHFILASKRRVVAAIRNEVSFWRKWDAAGNDSGDPVALDAEPSAFTCDVV